MKKSDIFVGGQDGYHTYRIPSIIVTQEGTVLAFCEGRQISSADKSPTDMVLKRSRDGGSTWKPMQIVVKGVPHAIMDPCPVVDHATGTIHLLYDRYPEGFRMSSAGFGMDSGTGWVTRSTDDGRTWSEPVNITETTKKREWTQIAHGPGVSIQTRAGRLVTPCCSKDVDGQDWAFTIHSDDHGETWRLGKETGPLMCEPQVVERADGSLMLNMRSNRKKGCRAVSMSSDGGENWSEPIDVPELIEPVCQASIVRYEAREIGGMSPLLFSNPASADRTKMTVKLSYDEGVTWPVEKLIHAGPSAYSCLTVLPNGDIACLYECGENWPYEKITLARFDLEWLAKGS